MNVSDWFTGAKDRAKESLIYAVGGVSIDENDPFEMKYKKFKTYVDDLKRVCDAFQLYVDAMDTLSNTMVCFGDAMAQLHMNTNATSGLPSPMENVTEIFKTIQKDIDDNIRPAAHDVIKEKCIAPVLYILSQVPSIDSKYQQRRSLLIDHDFYKSRLQRETAGGGDSNSDSKLRLQEKVRALSLVQMEIDVSLEEFEEVKDHMLGPELSALIGSMYFFASSIGTMYSQMFPLLPQSSNNFTQLVTESGISSVPPNALNSKYCIGKQQNSFNKVQYLKGVGKFKNFIVEPTLARPEMAGGACGGYELVPSLHERRLHDMLVTAADGITRNENQPMIYDSGKEAHGAGAVGVSSNPLSSAANMLSDNFMGLFGSGANSGATSGTAYLKQAIRTNSPMPQSGTKSHDNSFSGLPIGCSTDAEVSPEEIITKVGPQKHSPTDNESNNNHGNRLDAFGHEESGSVDGFAVGSEEEFHEHEHESHADADENIEDLPEIRPTPPLAPEEAVLMRVTAVFDFESDTPDDLTFEVSVDR